MYIPLTECFLLAIVEGSIQLDGAKMHESSMLYKVYIIHVDALRLYMFLSTLEMLLMSKY